MLFSKSDDTAKILEAQIGQLSEQLAKLSGELSGKKNLIVIANEYEAAKKQLVDLQIELSGTKEQHARETREIEHKLGLHRQQVEAESKLAQKQAEAERVAAVTEAKLAVQEGNLDAERTRFEQEIEFRTKRFEEEAKTLRNLTEQILNRLPTVNFERTIHTTQHIGDPLPELEAGPE